MVSYKTIIKKFASKGEKTGWTYIDIPAGIAEKINPDCKKSFRIKGSLNNTELLPTSILPMGEGNFILPLKADLRKKIGAVIGNQILVSIELEQSEYKLNADFIDCLKDEPNAAKYFYSLTKSHQNYFSKWIETAKTNDTKTNRIVRAINALAKGWGYVEMIRNKD